MDVVTWLYTYDDFTGIILYVQKVKICSVHTQHHYRHCDDTVPSSARLSARVMSITRRIQMQVRRRHTRPIITYKHKSFKRNDHAVYIECQFTAFAQRLYKLEGGGGTPNLPPHRQGNQPPTSQPPRLNVHKS